MKSIFLFLILLPVSVFAQDEGFLSKSKLLSETEVKIIPAQVVDKNQILPVFNSESQMPLFLINDKGMEKLEKIKNAKKIKLNVRTCGKDEMALPWASKTKNSDNPKFIAFGKNTESLEITWSQAKQVKSNERPKSVLYGKGYELTSFYVAEINGVDHRVFYSESKSPQLIKYEKEYKAQKDHRSSLPKIDCTKADLAYQKIGFLSGSKANVLLEAPINCEGQGYKQGSFSNPLGLLKISNGKVTEKWLVFLAAGYEGDAFLGIKLNDETPPKDESEIDFYVYSGC